MYNNGIAGLSVRDLNMSFKDGPKFEAKLVDGQ